MLYLSYATMSEGEEKISQEVTVSELFRFACRRCGLDADVVVAGEATAKVRDDGSVEDGHEIARASQSASRDARAMFRVLPCPRCHRRRSGPALGFIVERGMAAAALVALPFVIAASPDLLGVIARPLMGKLFNGGTMVVALAVIVISAMQWRRAGSATATVEPSREAPQQPSD